ncbi:MAG: beta-propeller fold lactonase family protein [Anaerolineales bacterium]|nr:beta-propeller fold lactonase family protein [Anaerolineales bacterium]
MKNKLNKFMLIIVMLVMVMGCATDPVTPTNTPVPNTPAVTPTVVDVQSLPNMGQQISPLAPQDSRFETMNPDLSDNPDWLAGQAVTTVVSPDKRTMLVLTSGFNRVYRTDDTPDAFGTYFNWPDSQEYVFIYDISTDRPVKKQVVQVPNTYSGIAFDPSGAAFYVSSGMGDFPFDSTGNVNPAKSAGDNVHIFILNTSTGTWQHDSELALGHTSGVGLDVEPPTGEPLPPNVRVAVSPCAAGVAVSNDGKTLVVANYYNDSITIFSGGLGNWSKGTELDLRPGKSDSTQAGVPGGEYPFWVVVKGNGSSATAYISSIRDREIVVVNLGSTPAVTARIAVKGQPNKMTLNAAQTLLYVVEDQSDSIDVIDTEKNTILETIPVISQASGLPASLAQYKGANPNSVTLSPDEKQLYVTLGNLNSIAVVALDGTNSGDQVVGLVPTGWYPTSVSFSGDGKWVYVANGKSPTGPNSNFYYSYGPPSHKNGYASNQYNPQLTKAGLQSFPLPSAEQLTTLTAQVAVNNRFAYTESAADAAVMAAVRQGIKHVIFIIKENRTYDQVLGDLEIGNGDPALAEFGEALTPNQHNLARNFVTLDNFYATSEVSYDGWAWSTSAQAQFVIQSQYPVAYAGRGLALDQGGLNRNINTALEGVAERQAANPFTPDDPDVLPGQTDVSAPDGPDNEVNTGFLWDSALRANLTVRNYGFSIDGTRYNFPQTSPYSLTLAHDPASTGTIVAYPSNVSLIPYTDPYFRGWDPTFPDYFRFKEWEREFDTMYIAGGEELPSLSLVRLMNDHTGNFATAIDGVNTPELQQADNDYAVGLLVEKISKSKYANNTLIFIIEDDAQDGPDHVDSHRTIAFVAGAYVKQGALVSTQYNTIDFLRTIEEVLGFSPMNLNDALARPMADIFNTTPSPWSFTAVPAPILYNTQLPLPPKPVGLIVPRPTHDAEYWAQVTQGVDFTSEDRMDFASYNRILWVGLMGDVPYPAETTGLDLRQNRKELLALDSGKGR